MAKKPAYEELEQRVKELEEKLANLKSAEKSFRESEIRYSSFLKHFQGIAYRGNIDFVPDFFHGAVETITGYKEENFLASKPRWDKIIHPEDFIKISDSLEKIRSVPNYVTQREYRIIRKDGKTRWIEENIQNICDDSETPVMVYGAIYDITERKQAEEELRKNERKTRAIFDQTNQFIGLLEKDGTLIEANKTSLNFSNLDASDVLGKPFWETAWWNHSPKLQQRLREAIKKASNGKPDRFEAYHYSANGTHRYTDCSIKPVFDEVGNVIFLIPEGYDVTERKLVEEALKKERNRSQQYLDLAGVMFVVIDVEQNVAMINKKGCEILGYEEREIVGKNWFDHFIKEDNVETLKRVFSQVISGNIESVEYYENSIITKGGNERIIAWHNSIIREESKGIVGTLSSGEDITDRKLAEKELGEAHSKLEQKVQIRTTELQKANDQLLDHQRKLRNLASRLTLAEEKERRRVARQVHDYIGQNLAFSKIKLNEFRKSVSPESFQELVPVIELINKTIGDTRDLINEFGSPVLYELGLVPAIESLTQQIQKHLNLNITFEDDKKPKPVSDDVKVFIFRATRELLANVAKHSQGADCNVSLKAEGEKVRLDIVDDGIGFEVEELESVSSDDRGFGFFSIRERLEPLGGSLGIYSKPNEGTRITLFAPLMI